MLVLSRKEGEQIAIGDHITITVVRITHNVVRIGIETREGNTVVRKELMGPAESADAREAPPRGLGR
jgi:carbon storage regulator